MASYVSAYVRETADTSSRRSLRSDPAELVDAILHLLAKLLFQDLKEGIHVPDRVAAESVEKVYQPPAEV